MSSEAEYISHTRLHKNQSSATSESYRLGNTGRKRAGQGMDSPVQVTTDSEGAGGADILKELRTGRAGWYNSLGPFETLRCLCMRFPIEREQSKYKGNTSVSHIFKLDPSVGSRCSQEICTRSTISFFLELGAHSGIVLQSSYATSSQSILITSTVFRSQPQNIQDCLQKVSSIRPFARFAGPLT